MKRKELVSKLELLQPALATSGLVPIFSCFTFTNDAITAFNGDALAIKADFKNKDVFAVNGKTLLGLLQNTKAEDLDIKIDKQEIRIKTGKSNFKLPFFNEEDFLFAEPNEEFLAETEITADLINGIKICLTTTSRDNSLPALMGLCFNFDASTLTTIFSCDGDAVTRYTTADGYVGKGIYTLPNSFCDALLKICNETEVVSGKLEMNCNWAKATLNNGFTVFGRIVTNKKPLDHAALIEETVVGELTFIDLPNELTEALNRARVIADAESKPTVLTVYNDKLDLLTESSLGEARDSLPMKGHKDVEAFVQAMLVQRSIEICNKISIRENCTVYCLNDSVLQVVSNIGE